MTNTPTNTPTPTPTPLPQFGIDDGGNLTGRPASIASARGAGAFWVRTSVSWNGIQPTEGGPYNWAGTDAGLNSLINGGLSPVVYITDNPAWAANYPCGPVDTTNTTKLTTFANVMGALAARYSQIKVWALYNEVDNSTLAYGGHSAGGCFGDDVTEDINGNGKKDYADMADMLAAAWKAVHQANPNAQLAMGAAAFDSFDPATCPPNYPGNCVGGGFNYNFLPNLFTYINNHPLAGGDAYMDALLFNYYDIYGRYWESQAAGKGIHAKASAIRQRMSTYAGTTWALLVSETGENSLDWGHDGQSKCLTTVMVRGMVAGLKGIVWWTFQDFPSSNPPPSKWWKYGIVDEAVNQKPSYLAYQALTQQLSGYWYSRTLSGLSGFAGIEAYEFAGGAQTRTVVWSSDLSEMPDWKPPCVWGRNSHTATFGPGANQLSAVDMYGTAATISDNGAGDLDARAGYIGLTIGAVPQFVQVNP